MSESDKSTDEYFEKYEDLEVHELMLRDQPRMQAYRDAILNNAVLFKNKVVMDVGAGTGILSAFCAQAGARLVYAVEASNLSKIALKVIEENDMTPVVKVFNCKVEDFKLPASAEKVDIIVSEWMGFYLVHEAMLLSVLFARDNFLKPDGIMFPRETTIYVAPCQVPSRYDMWEDVFGVRMTKFARVLKQQKSTSPELLSVLPEDLLHEGVAMHWMNLEDVKAEEIDLIEYKDLLAIKKPGKHQGFCIWFECRFPSEHYEDAVVLSTAPTAAPTHWKQCVLVLPEMGASDDELEVNAPIAFRISMKRKPNERRYLLELEMMDPDEIEHPLPCDCYMTKCILSKAHLIKMDTE